MNEESIYDVAIIGGGLAGLALSIQLSKKGYAVILFEKEQYPFHKVCGEYISMESWEFIKSLGIDLDAMKPSKITELQVSAVNGKTVQQTLPLGGFGISRYTLDNAMAAKARAAGVEIKENTKVNDVVFNSSIFSLQTTSGTYHSKITCGTFGKRSNLDVKWKRSFATTSKSKLDNYIGVKYHIRCDLPQHHIALHNFNNGYCGVVKIEDDKYCLCYLTTAASLRKAGGIIADLEKKILSTNPHLYQVFSNATFLYDAPVTISQISFSRKSQVEDHILLLGDAAGMITPLCGNGMSMALHASKIATQTIDVFLNGKCSRLQMESLYQQQWKKQFAKRMQTGRVLQRVLSNNTMINMFIPIAKIFPPLLRYLVKQTHGNLF
jgi:flavin-dependent dehydrogenase